jgi:hypothetical protein
VLDCIEHLLNQVKPANSDANRAYFTDGIVVDRRRDPRKVYADLATELKNKGAYIRIKEGPGKILTGNKGFVGNAYRTLSAVDLICWSYMTAQQDAAGITSDQLTSWLRHDINTALSTDEDGTTCIIRASVALSQQKGPWGDPGTWGFAPNCMDLVMTGWLDGPMSTWPAVMQVIQLSYLSDEYSAGRIPGTPQ